MTDPRVLHEFEWEHRGVVRACIDTFKGRQYASIRLWVESREQQGGDLIPTSKGISVPVEYAAEMLEACQVLAAAVATTPARRRAAV